MLVGPKHRASKSHQWLNRRPSWPEYHFQHDWGVYLRHNPPFASFIITPLHSPHQHMAPLSVETGTLLLVIFAAVALPGIPAVLFLVIRHCWMAYGDISPVVVERMEAVGEQLPYWLKLRRHPQFPVSLHEQIELLVQATERYVQFITNFQGQTNLLCRVDYTLREIRTGDRQRGWFPLRKAWDGRETYVEAAKALVQLVDKEASVSTPTHI